MQQEMTPAQKRKLTMEKRYGKNWRKHNGQLAKEARVTKVGEDDYKEQLSNAGKAGGANVPASKRPFKRDPKLAKVAGAKGLGKRWPKDDK